MNKVEITQMVISKEPFKAKSEEENLYKYSYEIRALKTIRVQNNVKYRKKKEFLVTFRLWTQKTAMSP